MLFPPEDRRPEDPRPTALYAAAASAASANSWASVNGFAAARVYTNVAEECRAAHAGAAVADIGPAARYALRGPDAGALLARVTSAPGASLEPGESARGLMLDDEGFVIDLIEASRLAPDLFLLNATRPHARRLQLAGRGLDAVAEDITAHVAALALIGPAARDAAALAGLDMSEQARARQARVRGVELSVRPTHFGALPAIEVICPFEEALTLWERLRRAARPTPIGLDALDVLRIEAGLPRPGVDFEPAGFAAPGRARRPGALGLAHLAPLDSAWFNGRRALARARAAEPHRLVALSIEAGEAEIGAAVHAGKSIAGRLTSVAYSPRLRRPIAFAEVSAAAALPFEVEGRGGARAPADILETAESRLEAAFAAAATESRPRRV